MVNKCDSYKNVILFESTNTTSQHPDASSPFGLVKFVDFDSKFTLQMPKLQPWCADNTSAFTIFFSNQNQKNI